MMYNGLFIISFCISHILALIIPSKINTHISSLKMHAYSETSEKYTEVHNSPLEETIDWNLYNLKREYQKSGGILYKQSILSTQEYTVIMKNLSQLTLHIEDEKQSSFATNRVGCTIGRDTEIYNILSCGDGSLCKLINSLEEQEECGPMILAPDIPVELRIYEKPGAGMEWHRDDILYNPCQIEVVLTLENSSDCSTMWKPHNGDIQSVQTTPNSALILKSGDVEHKVSSLRTGKRTILKVAFVREDAVMLENMVGHASHHNGETMKKKKRKR